MLVMARCLSHASFCVESTGMAKLLEFAEARSRAVPGSGENLLITHILLEKVVNNSGYLSVESVCKHSGLMLSASAFGKEADQKGHVDAVLSKSCQLLSNTLGCPVTPAVVAVLLQATEHYAWVLDGHSLLSPLTHLLQLVAQAPTRLHALTAHQRVSAALLTVGPLLHQLQGQHSANDLAAGAGNGEEGSITEVCGRRERPGASIGPETSIGAATPIPPSGAVYNRAVEPMPVDRYINIYIYTHIYTYIHIYIHIRLVYTYICTY